MFAKAVKYGFLLSLLPAALLVLLAGPLIILVFTPTYTTGDWAGDEGWLSDASLASAQRAAELILQKPPVARSRATAGVG